MFVNFTNECRLTVLRAAHESNHRSNVSPKYAPHYFSVFVAQRPFMCVLEDVFPSIPFPCPSLSFLNVTACSKTVSLYIYRPITYLCAGNRRPRDTASLHASPREQPAHRRNPIRYTVGLARCARVRGTISEGTRHARNAVQVRHQVGKFLCGPDRRVGEEK